VRKHLWMATLLCSCTHGDRETTTDAEEWDEVTEIEMSAVGPGGFSGEDVLAAIVSLQPLIFTSSASFGDPFGVGEGINGGVPYHFDLHFESATAESVLRHSTSWSQQEFLRVRGLLSIQSTDGTLDVSGSTSIAAFGLDPSQMGWEDVQGLVGLLPSWVESSAEEGIGNSHCADGDAANIAAHGTVGVVVEGGLVTPNMGVAVDWDDELVARSECRVRREFIDLVTLSNP
jgi:hypothetical protein